MKLEAEETITHINRLKKNLQALQSEEESEKTQVMTNRVDREISHITAQLESLAASINRLADIRSKRILGSSGQLYNLNSEPEVTSNFMGQIKALIKYTLFGAIAGVFFGLLVALLLAMTSKPKLSTN